MKRLGESEDSFRVEYHEDLGHGFPRGNCTNTCDMLVKILERNYVLSVACSFQVGGEFFSEAFFKM